MMCPWPLMRASCPAHVAPIAAGEEIGSWGYGVSVYGAAWGHKREVETPSLMADMFGFMSKEEMSDTKEYLRSHRKLLVGAGGCH